MQAEYLGKTFTVVEMSDEKNEVILSSGESDRVIVRLDLVKIIKEETTNTEETSTSKRRSK